MELINTDLKKTIQCKKIISSHLVKLQHGYMEEQIKSTMQFFFLHSQINYINQSMFYCSKFYFDIIHVASADEYYNKFKDTTCSLCYAYFF